MHIPARHSIVVALISALVAVPALAGPVTCFEAESATRVDPPMQSVSAAEAPSRDAARFAALASGKGFIAVPQGKGNPPKVEGGEAELSFALDADGRQTLWARVWWFDECGNSLTMQIDDGPPFTFGQDSTFKRWHWVKAPDRLKQLDLKAGPHTLIIRNREDGVRVDQVLFSRDKRYVPVGIEELVPAP
jgi:hypothetical protein